MIAEVVRSRYDNVKRTIERLTERRVIVQPPLEDEPETDAMGRTRVTQVYRLGKLDSITVVAQLSPEFTAARAWADEVDGKMAAQKLAQEQHALLEHVWPGKTEARCTAAQVYSRALISIEQTGTVSQTYSDVPLGRRDVSKRLFVLKNQ